MAHECCRACTKAERITYEDRILYHQRVADKALRSMLWAIGLVIASAIFDVVYYVASSGGL